jgi:putative hemolysin
LGNAFEVVIILVLTVLNGVFSMSETAVVSVKRVLLQKRAEAGDDRARDALELARQPDRFLSTVQVGITLIGILAGTFGGARLSADIAAALQKVGVPTNLSNTLGLILVVAFITYVSLVIGELVPKTIALNDPENVACRVARPMTLLSRFMSPVVGFLAASTRAVLWLLRIRPADEGGVTEDEVKLLIRQGTRAGIFEEEEQEIVEGVFRTADRRVSSLMSPRREIVYLDVEDSWAENRAKIRASGYSAYPVCAGSLDHVLGVVVLKRLWEAWETSGAGGEVDLRAVAQPPLYLPEGTQALVALDRFKGARQHIALVVDEYGGVVGLFTLHDVVEAMVGEVPDAQPRASEAVRRPDGSWLVDGQMATDEFRHLLDVRELPPDEGEYATMGGLAMALLERIPAVGDRFTWAGLAFEIVDMDGNRVDRLLVTPPTPPTSAGDGGNSGEP